MEIIILLFTIGLLLLALEVMIPGGILGIGGGILLFTGCILSFVTLGTTEGIIAICITIVAAIIIFYIQFKILPNTRMGRQFFLSREIKGSSSNFKESSRDLIGKIATSVTVLSPSGVVLISGKQYQAMSESGQIPKDTELEVISANSFQLTVRTKK